MNKRDALLEVRMENIPARFVTSAEAQLEAGAAALLSAAGLPYESVKAYGTYKRLVLYITGLPPKTGEKDLKAFGPLAKLWKDGEGNFTPQSSGFAKSQGTTPDKLVVEKLPKGEVLTAINKIPCRPVVKVLAEILPKLISGLEFPKTMVWEETRVRFARPVRSLLALYGNKVVPFSFAGVKTGRLTVGLSARGSRPVRVASAEKYFKLLENVNVLVKDEERGRVLAKEIEQVCRRTKLEVDADPGSLKENLYLVEYPVCVLGAYDQEFLKLPAELVDLVMKKQLKFFPVRDARKRQQPYFVGVRDGVSKGQKNVEEGFRNVLEARFRDALFFYARDLAVPLDDMAARLKSVVFQEKLGSMADKTARVSEIAGMICESMNADPSVKIDSGEVIKAARYVYADLTGNVVREFPELQGVMGSYYARNAGLSETAAKAIGGFYRPLNAKSPLPSSPEGSALSLAGKADSLISYFYLGLIPSGSADPNGLRRQAMGIVRIVLEKGISIDLRKLLACAPGTAPEDAGPFLDFIWQRADAIFGEAGYKFDEIKAVKRFFLEKGDLLDCQRRLKDLNAARKHPDFDALVTAFKRAQNVIKQADYAAGAGGPDAAVFTEDEERTLYADITALSTRLKAYIANRDYAKSLGDIVTVKPALDEFFEKVMVMAEDPALRENRLRLVSSLVSLFESVADLSQLQQ